MQAKQFFALFLLIIISVDAITPEAKLTAIIQKIQSQVATANSSALIEQVLNNVPKGLVALLEENNLMFDSESSGPGESTNIRNAGNAIHDAGSAINIGLSVASDIMGMLGN